MEKTPTRLVLVRTKITEHWQERLQQISPDLHFEFRPGDSTTDINDDLWKDVEILYGGKLPTQEQVPSLRWVQLFSAGVDQLLTQPLFKSNITFTTSSGVHSTNIGEYVITDNSYLESSYPQLQELQKKSPMAIAVKNFTTTLCQKSYAI